MARMKGNEGYLDSQDEDKDTESQSESVSIQFPIAILAPMFQRSFRFSSRWDRKTVDCDRPAHNLHIAMPALINREAMALMGNAVEAQGMTEHQNTWGGTHDMLLGLWLWMYRIPLVSVRKVYFGGMIASLYKEKSRGDTWIRNIDPKKKYLRSHAQEFQHSIRQGVGRQQHCEVPRNPWDEGRGQGVWR